MSVAESIEMLREPAAELELLIKSADRQAAFLEATRLAGFESDEARRFFGRPPKFSAALERDYLKPWPVETAQARYLERFKKLAGRETDHKERDHKERDQTSHLRHR